jgi:hypothetical protein
MEDNIRPPKPAPRPTSSLSAAELAYRIRAVAEVQKLEAALGPNLAKFAIGLRLPRASGARR